jgi:hypothetical protein
MSWDEEYKGWPMDEPIGWVVIRRCGGWNGEPEVLRFYESESPAMLDACLPEMVFDHPPGDQVNLYTYHAVMPPKWPHAADGGTISG